MECSCGVVTKCPECEPDQSSEPEAFSDPETIREFLGGVRLEISAAGFGDNYHAFVEALGDAAAAKYVECSSGSPRAELYDSGFRIGTEAMARIFTQPLVGGQWTHREDLGPERAKPLGPGALLNQEECRLALRAVILARPGLADGPKTRAMTEDLIKLLEAGADPEFEEFWGRVRRRRKDRQLRTNDEVKSFAREIWNEARKRE